MHNKYYIFLLFLMTVAFCYAQEAKIDSARIYFDKGIEFDNLNQHDKAFECYIKSKAFSKADKDEKSVANCNLKIFQLIDSQSDLNLDALKYLKEYDEYARKELDTAMLITSLRNFR